MKPDSFLLFCKIVIKESEMKIHFCPNSPKEYTNVFRVPSGTTLRIYKDSKRNVFAALNCFTVQIFITIQKDNLQFVYFSIVSSSKGNHSAATYKILMKRLIPVPLLSIVLSSRRNHSTALLLGTFTFHRWVIPLLQ